MRGLAIIPAIPVLLALLAAPALGQPSPVTVTLAPNGVTVGDHATATLTVRARAADLAADPLFPVWGKAWGEAEIVAKGEPVKTAGPDGTAVWEQRLVLRAFRPGSVPLPPVGVDIPLRAGTLRAQTPGGLALAVRSVIPQGEKEPKPKPPAALRSLPFGARFWWTAGLLGALCLAGLWLLRRWRGAAAPAEAARPALPPFEELAAELDRLAAEPSMLTLHTRLSLALRRYLGRRLPFPAVESTTAEIQRQLLSRRAPGAPTRQTVELLRACDLVKFARQEVDEARARERVAAARRLAGDFESHFAPPEPQAQEPLEATG
jgi:hypothetical protein